MNAERLSSEQIKPYALTVYARELLDSNKDKLTPTEIDKLVEYEKTSENFSDVEIKTVRGWLWKIYYHQADFQDELNEIKTSRLNKKSSKSKADGIARIKEVVKLLSITVPNAETRIFNALLDRAYLGMWDILDYTKKLNPDLSKEKWNQAYLIMCEVIEAYLSDDASPFDPAKSIETEQKKPRQDPQPIQKDKEIPVVEDISLSEYKYRQLKMNRLRQELNRYCDLIEEQVKQLNVPTPNGIDNLILRICYHAESNREFMRLIDSKLRFTISMWCNKIRQITAEMGKP